MKGQFTYMILKDKQDKFFYLTGLTTHEFDCLYECVETFLYLIRYPDCKGGGLETKSRKLDTKTELMAFFTICRHSLHLGIMARMVQTSVSTISRAFIGWAVFLSTVFECLELKPLPGIVQAYLPQEFYDACHGETEALGDATETWINQSENYDIKNITFSSYKNHTTGKTSVWIYSHGGPLPCSDTYPGTVCDKDITEQCGVLDKVNKGKVILTDKGFDMADLCYHKGLLHNRPPLKFDSPEQSDVSKHFDIATLRINNENFIGRMRDWTILNACWPMNRVDLLGYCFKIFAHIVNTLKSPVGPKGIVQKSVSK